MLMLLIKMKFRLSSLTRIFQTPHLREVKDFLISIFFLLSARASIQELRENENALDFIREITFLPKNDVYKMYSQIHIFYKQLDFSSEPGVANEILENEPKSCSTVAF